MEGNIALKGHKIVQVQDFSRDCNIIKENEQLATKIIYSRDKDYHF